MHNTMGRNCQECKPFFYKDPEKDIRDPLVCRSCDCDPVGSEHGGECDLVSGRCICKRFVEGRRCDQCMHGYWNMAPENPEGCEPCSCHTLGTVGNYGCDKRTGECRCKRFVTGRNCDQCLPQYWGLGDDIEGCKPCNCDVGGSYDNKCDQQTGQCNCRPNIIGRHCDQPAPGFFITNLDYLIYEAEFAEGVGNTRVVIRESQPGRRVTWTGPGFMRVSEGDSLIFEIPDIPMSMEYEIVIRYEAQMGERWDDVRVTVIRPGPVDQRGPCANSIPQDDFKVSSLPRGTTHYLVSPSSCLEAGVSYQIRIDFNHYKSGRTTPQASALIDSIALFPSVNSIPIFQGPGAPLEMRLEFERFNCREQQMAARSQSDISDVCKQYIFSISSIVQKGALDCTCDKTGSISTTCDPIGGQCTCKHNVIGRTCDQCAPGTYNFSPRGCTQCNCNAIGSRDNFCEVTTGQCLCLPNVYGRQCDQCQQGFWGFPNCRTCQCNGRADICDNESGQCLYCRDNTGGHHCERCASGYYGDPRPGSRVGCRPCMCPGGVNSGFQHADTCRLDTRTNQAICDCRPGYTGPNCNRCANNYFGNPLVPGGTCQACECNNNIDPASPGNCDATTGRCLQCIYNTEGFNCERCSAGYYGDARDQNCQACVCNLLGTDRNAGPCDPRTGQCACLPNVIGLRCDSCAPNFWKIASGEGCESCNCDPRGALSTQCNEFDGQCQCITGRGGRTCADCEDNYWGDPSHQCFPCDCDRVGSATLQCDRHTGACECLEGVGGHKCDRCARGTTGFMPNCVPCGECFDDWDRIISELSSQTNRLIQEGSEIKIGGVKGIFEAEFRSMEDKLDEVRRILAGTNVTQHDLDRLQDSLNNIRKNLTDSNVQLDTVNKEVIDTSDRIETANNRIEAIRRNVDKLKMTAEELKRNATRIREMDIIGAYNSTLESERRSKAAQWKVDSTTAVLDESVTVREQVDLVIEQQRDGFDERYEENEAQLTTLSGEISTLDGRIVDLNEMVCDGRGEPCDSLCGGAGCGKCGGLSCEDGSVTKANNAMDLAKRAEKTLAERKTESQALLSELRGAETHANEAKAAAQEAYDSASAAKNESEGTLSALDDLMSRITEYMEQNGAKPAEIRQVAEEVLAMSISLQPEEIRDLARQINETIRGLTDIDTILAETKGDLERANDLKARAGATKEGADNVLDTAQRVLEALKRASEAQDAARNAIAKAEEDIMKAEEDLVMIESETTAGVEKSRETLDRVNDLKERLDSLKTTFTENEVNVQRAANEADVAEGLANQAEQDADDLDRKYTDVAIQLETKYNATRTAKEQADNLRDRASSLYQNTYEKIERLKVMGDEFDRNEKTLGDLSHEINELNQRMKVYFTDIQQSARRLRTCG
ncbi:hypothetical protein NP493_542g02038 [Ridgeia piscesae]|uniref:Laminin subunit beta-1 n=1 Tax=Ridgeia piscesae TaxID=27915 RepID=A0AAD9NS16_RIDPI|nr:hypothetical protein NP493_542g02038 [Ridgeia piscesae]